MAYPVLKTASVTGIEYPDIHRVDYFLKLSPRKTKGAKSKSQKIRSNRRKSK